MFLFRALRGHPGARCARGIHIAADGRVLDEEMVVESPGRGDLELVLEGLVERGLMTKSRATNAGGPRRSDGQRIYEDDWWDVTPCRRPAVGPLRDQLEASA